MAGSVAGGQRSHPWAARLGGLRRTLAPISEARGMTRTMLWLGLGITLAFV